MPDRTTSEAALDAAGLVGIWRTDVAAARSRLDAGAAAVLAGDAGLAETPLPLEVALGRIHPGDRDWVFERIRRVRRTGGPVSIEFRVRAGDGGIRWILVRGSLAPDAGGGMRGQGAYLDTTDWHRDRLRAVADGPAEAADEPLREAADHALRLREAVRRGRDPFLRALVDLLLFEVGRALAKRSRN